MNIHPDVLIADFIQVAALAGIIITAQDVEYEILPAPHTRPKKLPVGKMAVYVFCTADKCLKVGKVGMKSHARFTSQHYSPGSAKSNLAKSLLNDKTSVGVSSLFFLADDVTDLSENNVGTWIAQNTTRYHFYLDEARPRLLLSLLEVFLHCRLQPIFEGG